MGKGKSDEVAVCGIVTCYCLIVMLLFGLIVFNIAKIVMGAVYFHECSIEKNIPIFLIVSGLASILASSNGRRNDEEIGLCWTSCGITVLLCNIAWVILGSIWIYPSYGKLSNVDFKKCEGNMTADCLDDICDKDLIQFAIASVTIDWLFMGLWSCLICYQVRAIIRRR
ncbi:uncharacterized protein LOC123555494 [Mercenaria mercenaria]|uniref:uncharacterized protein LOC123555494 n=1 Tax=Mercenaria mercenaria TaxID=6596 RepID=UPI001E1D79A0|nr:uncharacterized protein LOC123555494 [Mercenaria mercenaria]